MTDEPEKDKRGKGKVGRPTKNGELVWTNVKIRKGRVGRPSRVFTLEQIKKAKDMAFDNCKNTTIAGVLDCKVDVLVRNLGTVLHKKRCEGNAELRKDQRKMSHKQPVMAIFLGKNQLDQSDKKAIELGGKDGTPIPVTIVDFAKITEDDDTK